MKQQRGTRPPPTGHIVAQPDPEMPEGMCAVIVEDVVVYVGVIGSPMVPFIVPGAMLVLHPNDFEDGNNFMKRQLN